MADVFAEAKATVQVEDPSKVSSNFNIADAFVEFINADIKAINRTFNIQMVGILLSDVRDGDYPSAVIKPIFFKFETKGTKKGRLVLMPVLMENKDGYVNTYARGTMLEKAKEIIATDESRNHVVSCSVSVGYYKEANKNFVAVRSISETEEITEIAHKMLQAFKKYDYGEYANKYVSKLCEYYEEEVKNMTKKEIKAFLDVDDATKETLEIFKNFEK